MEEGGNLRELRHGQNHPDGGGVDDEEGRRDAQSHRLDGGVVEIHIGGHHRVGDDRLAQEDADGHDFDQAAFVHDLAGQETEGVEGDDHAAEEEESEADEERVAAKDAEDGQRREHPGQGHGDQHFIFHDGGCDTRGV